MKILGWTARIACAFACISAASGNTAAPLGLLVNGVPQPLAMDRHSARFTWRLPEGGRGETQSAYQILVSSRAKNLGAGMADCWDSGKVESSKAAAVEYAGKPLAPAARYWWMVRVWDGEGVPGPYSDPEYFDTGLSPEDWKARYIWDGTTNLNNFAYFRKAFSLALLPERAKVYITAHNDYLLYLNGRLLGRGPARCDPEHYGQYLAYDVTKLVKTGSNAFAAIGHWQGNWLNSGVNARPAFLLDARFDYSGGSNATIGTDSSWKVLADTPFVETNATYFGGAGGAFNRAAIQYDARRELDGWRAIDFDDSHWASASVVERTNFHLFAQMAPVEREQAELKPVSVSYTNRVSYTNGVWFTHGVWCVDFGRCIDGWPKLALHANHPGDVVRLEYFQMPGGRKAAGWDQYTCRGGLETWRADFGRHTSFQEIRITGYAGELSAADIRGIWAYSDARVSGHFHCSRPLLNSIYEMCERSARQNIQQAIISVDANREQSPWTADSWNIGNVLLYNDENTTMLDKVVRDYAGEQLAGGDFPACCPARRRADYLEPLEKSRRIPEWSMYWPMLLWQQYLFSGDAVLLREMAPHLARFLDSIRAYQDPATGLINPGGWRISDYAGGRMPGGGTNIATECQYYENLRIAGAIFSVLGQGDLASGYSRDAEKVKASINSLLFNGDFYLARTDRKEMFPLASAWALRFDIEPPSARAKILAAITARKDPQIGGYGGDAFYSGLLNAGGGAFVAEDLARYRPMLNENKANWEGFDMRNEVNHAWTSYPGYLFLKYICGIQPTSGGFATFDVRPETGGLTYAEGSVPTVKGLISTRWDKATNGGFSLSIHVPPNTRATIYIPTLSRKNFTITESGKIVWPSPSSATVPGILETRQEDEAIKYLVGAGSYQFIETPIARQ